MKKLYTYLILIIAASLAACGSSKHIVKASMTVNDTLIITVHDTFTLEKNKVEYLYKHDTTIITPGAAAAQVIRPKQLVPGASYRTSSGHVHNTASIDDSGNIHINCEADSLKTVISNLVEHTITQDKEIQRLSASSTVKSNHTAASYSDYYKKTKSWLAGNWLPTILIIVVLFLAELAYRRYRR